MLKNTLSNLRVVSKNRLRKLVRKYGITRKDEFIHDMQAVGQDLYGENITETAASNIRPQLVDTGQSSKKKWDVTTRFALCGPADNPQPSAVTKQPLVSKLPPVKTARPVLASPPPPVVDYGDTIIREASPLPPPFCLARDFTSPVPEVGDVMAIDTSPLIDPEDMEIDTDRVSALQGRPTDFAADKPLESAPFPSLGMMNTSISFWQPALFPNRPSNMDGTGGGIFPALVIVPSDISAYVNAQLTASGKQSLPVVGASNAFGNGLPYLVPPVSGGVSQSLLEQRAPEFPNPACGSVWHESNPVMSHGANTIDIPRSQFPMPLVSDRLEYISPSSVPTFDCEMSYDDGQPSLACPTSIPSSNPVATHDERGEAQSPINCPDMPYSTVISATDRTDRPSVTYNQPMSPILEQNEEDEDEDNSPENNDEDEEPKTPFEREDTAPLEEGEDQPPAVFLDFSQLPSSGSLNPNFYSDRERPSEVTNNEEDGNVQELSPVPVGQKVAQQGQPSTELVENAEGSNQRRAPSLGPRIEECKVHGPNQAVGIQQVPQSAHHGTGGVPIAPPSHQVVQNREATIQEVIAQRRRAIRSGQDISLLQSPRRVERDDDDERPDRPGSAKRVRSNSGAARSAETTETERATPLQRASAWDRRSSNWKSRKSSEATSLRSILKNRGTTSGHTSSTDLSAAGPSTLPGPSFTFTVSAPDLSSGNDVGVLPSVRHPVANGDQGPCTSEAQVSASRNSNGESFPVRYTDEPLPPLEDLLQGMTVNNGPQRLSRSVSFAVPEGPERSVLRQRSSMLSREARNSSVRAQIGSSRLESSAHGINRETNTTNRRSERGRMQVSSMRRPSTSNDRSGLRSRTSTQAISTVT